MVTFEDRELEDAVMSAHDALDDDQAADVLARLSPRLKASTASPGLRAEAHGLCAVAARALGLHVEARAHAQAACDLLEPPASDEDRSALAAILEDAAEIEIASRSYAAARRCLERAVALRGELGEAVVADTWLALAEVAQHEGDWSRAMDAAARALAAATGDDDLESQALALELRGDILAARAGSTRPAADEAYALAGEQWAALGDPTAAGRCLLGRARLAEQSDDAAALGAHVARLRTLEIPEPPRTAMIDEAEELLLSFEPGPP